MKVWYSVQVFQPYLCFLDDLEGKVKWLSSFERLREIQQMLIWPADQEELDSSRVCPHE